MCPRKTFSLQTVYHSCQKTRLVLIAKDICIDVDDPNWTDANESTPTDATDCAEEYEIDGSDLEEGNADLECLGN